MKAKELKKLLIVFFMCLAMNGFSQTKVNNTDPNIVLFVVDDMGWQDTSVPFWNKKTPFNERYHTPNMEKLARQGMKFTQAYATPICSPSRVSLLTGANAARHRVTNWTLRKNQSQDAEDDQLVFPQWNMNGISPEPGIENTFVATTLPQLLKDHGYFTVHSGKAHFGAINTPGENPLNLGFDVNIAGHAAGAPESYLGTENFGVGKPGKSVWAVPGLEKYHGKDIFLTEAITREALLALELVAKKQPFFLYLSHYAVHIPIMGDKRFLQKYLDAGLDPTEANYASMVEGMDKSLGDVMEFLEEKGIAKNTIILFMSDNGGLSARARGGEPNTHNKPLSSGKGSMYEGGIRVPMMVSWPGKVGRASQENQYVIIEDFFPTILEIANIEMPTIPQEVDGTSFVPLLFNKDYTPKNRTLFWHFPNKWGGSGPGIGTASMVRNKDWKLIYFHKNRKFELYNIAKDIGEKKNLFREQPEKARELAKLLTRHLKDTNAQMPIDRNTGKKVEYPEEILEKALHQK